MISVRNLLPRLSGNSIWVLILILTIASCGTTKKTPRRTNVPPKKDRTQVVRPSTKNDDKKEKEEGGIAPINKGNTKTNDDPVVKDDPVVFDDGVEKEVSYDVTFIAPFDTKRTSPNQLSEDRFMQYYGGMIMAAEDLADKGATFTFDVADTKDQPINEVLNNHTSSRTDVIIGPYDRGDLKYAIDFGKRKEIPVVSPWQSLNGVSNPTEYYVQLVPYLTEYYYSIMDHISKHYPKQDVFILGRRSNSKDTKRIAGFQNLARAYYKTSEAKPMHELYAEMSDLDGEDPVFLQHLESRNKTVFLIPHWSGSDYEYVYNLLRRISLEKSLNDVVIYGMFSMLDNPNITFELYNTLNLRVATPNFVDQEKYEVKRFKRDFLNLFGTLPTEDAYEGYDDFMFIGNALYKYGKNFQFHLDKERDILLQSQYDINKVHKDDRYDVIQYFENKHVDLIEFKKDGFNRVD